MHTFSIKEAIVFGWNKFWERPWFFIGTYLIIGIFNVNFQSRADETSPDVSSLAFVVLVFLAIGIAIIQMIIRMGEKRLLLNAYENTNSASIKDLWTPHPFWRFVGGQILYALIVVAGLILLIVPGIIWSLKYVFTPFIIMDRGVGPIDALKESSRITDGHKWQLFLFALALIGLNILGFLCLIVGVLVSAPVSALAMVYAYRTLQHRASEKASVPSTVSA
jgi:uncharacterized membrane protein